MATRRQIRANRQNAKKSTGPQTEEGRRRSSNNAMKHGILSQEVLISGEDPEEFEMFRQELVDDAAPAGPMEALLADQMVTCMWRYRRMLRVESGLFEYRHFEAEAAHYEREAESNVEIRFLLRDDDDLLVERTVVDADALEEARSRKNSALSRQQSPLAQLGRGFAEDEKTYSALARYKSAILRDYYKAYHEFERLQRARGGEIVPPPVSLDVSVTGVE